MNLREAIKWGVRAIANLAILPLLCLHAFKVPFLGKHRALEGSTQLLALVPGISGQYLRRAFLAWSIAECHPSASIGFGTIFSKTTARIGPHAYLGPYCSVGDVTIERDCLIATGSHLLSGGRLHGTADVNRPIREQPGEILHVTLGEGCWIGAGVIVMADVGAASIVGAGAVVTQPIPPRVVAAGIPARVIRERTADPDSR